MKPPYDYLIVGSGLYGSTFARLATDRGYSCLVIDKRHHTGGNLYCEPIEGINVHTYGAHIFHTSDERVWRFVNSFVPFNSFINSPIAVAPDGHLYSLPFNMHTFYRMWGVKTPAEARAILDRQREDARTVMEADGAAEPRNLEEQAIMLIGRDIYEQLIKGYTEKQWGRPCSSLPAFIIRRLPVRMTFDTNYFNDTRQGIPIGGYNNLISKLLEGSEVITNTDYFDCREHWNSQARRVVFTGRIDEYFGFMFGRLDYRSLRFETETLDTPNYQGNAVVNFTSHDVPYTRIIEHKHFEAFGDAVYNNPCTVISREYPAEWSEDMEPFYPINNDRNQNIHSRYIEYARATASKVIFGGRLAEYRYYDMAPIIAKLLDYDFDRDFTD